MNNEEDRTLISIEDVNGIKYIHFLGYGYFAGEMSDKPYRWVEYTGLISPISEVIKVGATRWEAENGPKTKQYIEDLTESEFDTMCGYPVIAPKEITEEIPCGLYYLDCRAVRCAEYYDYK